MREIKFRAWDKKQIDIYGTGLSYGEVEYYDDMVAFRFNHFESDQNDIILEQFTGLHDKNGKEIYEGDICEIVRFNGDSRIVGAIFYEKGSFKIENGYAIGSTDSIGGYKANIVKVIGNIHENPELLK